MNLASTILSSNDVKTGMKSAIKALGTNNPFTINTAGEVSTTVAVQGGRMFAFKIKYPVCFGVNGVRILYIPFLVILNFLSWNLTLLDIRSVFPAFTLTFGYSEFC